MTTITKYLLILIPSSIITISVSSQTLKERIDQTNEVKVYFNNKDIISKSNTSTEVGSTSAGSGCENFTEVTPIPIEYVEALNEVIDLLNNGFNTKNFVAGNFSAINNLPLAYNGDLNWQKLGEPLTFYISTSGAYFIRRQPGVFDREHSLEIQSYLYVYSVNEGKLKNLETKMLVLAKSPIIKTDKCEDYAFFEKNFPAASLVEQFKSSLGEGIKEFSAKQMKKHEKAMKKKK